MGLPGTGQRGQGSAQPEPLFEVIFMLERSNDYKKLQHDHTFKTATKRQVTTTKQPQKRPQRDTKRQKQLQRNTRKLLRDAKSHQNGAKHLHRETNN